MKLSELPMNAMLMVQHRYDGDFEVMSKADFLVSAHFLDYPVEPFPNVTLAEKDIKSIDIKGDLYDWIYWLGECDTYEDWNVDVYNDVCNEPETKAFIELMNKAFERHVTYFEGKPVEVDVYPKGAK